MEHPTRPAPGETRPDDEQRIVEIVRDLAVEVGGQRAAAAVSPTASLERDVGLGSLERVELLVRIEAGLGRDVADGFLSLDTPREIARALAGSTATRAPAPSVPVSRADTAVRVDDAKTLDEILIRRAAAEPRRVHAYIDDGADSASVSYGALRDGAARIAAALAARGVRRGDRVAIMLPTGLDFLQSFAGTLLAGAVAVPLYPPARLDRIGEYLERQSRILANAGARILIAMPEATPVARVLRESVSELAEIITAGELRAAPPPGTGAPESPRQRLDSGDPALIQYTSGSTGDPRGVVLSHGAILANIRAISAGVDVRPTDVIVSWLPLYHDMGLIGAWLSAMVWGIPIALMSPLEFLQRPERWLRAIDRHRGTLTAAPNFAFELCVRKVRDESLDGLDLSTWRCALNGAEPVNAGTLDRFAQRFERYGFRREALMPVYGLAESAVALAFPPRSRVPVVDRIARDPFEQDGRATPAPASDASALEFVSVGHALPGHEIGIVDASGRAVGERVVGRLHFRGPSSMLAYHANPQATAAAILPDGWVDSGDLAYRAGAELFITGRIKDVIIKAGRNLVPQEIEDVAASVEGIRKGCVVAFGVADESRGTERLVILAESRLRGPDDHDRLEQAVRARVATEVGVPPDDVVIVAPGAVPKTPSGKIRRHAARAAYISGSPGARAGGSLALRARLVALALPRLAHRAARAVGRAAYAGYLTIASTVAGILLGPAIGLLLVALPRGRPVRTLSRIVSRIVVAVTACRVTIEGRERLPRRGPIVLVANHTSYADVPVLLAALPMDFVIVAMQEVLDWRVIGTFVRRSEHPTVVRGQAQRSVAGASAIEGLLRAGHSVLFFPEGRLGAGDELGPLRLGAFETAGATGAPIVPVAIVGAHRILPDGTRLPRPGRIDVRIGEPIVPEGEGWRAVVRLRDRAAAAIAEALAR